MLDLNRVRALGSNGQPILISVFRNELRRAPRFLDHYRKLEIGTIIVIDNGSSDGTAQYLNSQADVIVLQTDASFSAANYGMDWINAVRLSLPADSWTLFADADEYLVYRDWPHIKLSEMLHGVPQGCNAIPGFMLDIYPRGDLSVVNPDDDLLQSCRFFDCNYIFRRQPRKPWDKMSCNLEVIGGPRVRLLSTLARESTTTWFDYFIRGQIDRLLKITPRHLRRFVIENYPASLPSLKKTPLLRGHRAKYINNHDVTGTRYHRDSVVLLHYKFTSEFAEKVNAEADRGQHYRFGAEYMLYRKHMCGRDKLTLFLQGESVEFRSAMDLVNHGLFRDVSTLLSDDPDPE